MTETSSERPHERTIIFDENPKRRFASPCLLACAVSRVACGSRLRHTLVHDHVYGVQITDPSLSTDAFIMMEKNNTTTDNAMGSQAPASAAAAAAAAADQSEPAMSTSASTATSSSRDMVAATLAELSESKGSTEESASGVTSASGERGGGDEDGDDDISLQGIDLSRKCENGYTEIFPQRVRFERS